MSESASSPWMLKVFPRIDGLPERLEVPAGGLTIGRAGSNDVVVPAGAFPQVSGHHARLRTENGELILEDLGSLNGCQVNGEQVSSKRLADGDIVKLGRSGPQFVVERPGEYASTVLLEPGTASTRRRDMSKTAIFRVKAALGVPADADVGEMVASSSRRANLKLLLSTALVAAAVALGFLYITEQSHAEVRRLETQNAQLRTQLAEMTDSFEGQRRAFEAQRVEWEAQKVALEQHRAILEQRIEKLAADDEASSAELARLRAELKSTTEDLARFNPVNLEQTKLEGVSRVRETVVFVETRVRLKHSKSGRLLRMLEGENGKGEVTFGDEGEIYERESTGSGFCVSPDGWIVTNAHVIRPPGHDRTIKMDRGVVLRPEIVVDVVFSDSDRRHRARLDPELTDLEADLALLKIEPFEGMPHLADFDAEASPPAPGTEVFLFGFPLGKMAMQEGDRVIASTFKGILSRVVSTYLQVDAAVHPGNSGGPLTDASGRVIGVVSRVQRTPDGPVASDIGYVIPIAAVKSLWPPPRPDERK